MHSVLGAVLKASFAFIPEKCGCLYSGFHWFLRRFPPCVPLPHPVNPCHTQLPFLDIKRYVMNHPKTKWFIVASTWLPPTVSRGQELLGLSHEGAVRWWVEQLGAVLQSLPAHGLSVLASMGFLTPWQPQGMHILSFLMYFLVKMVTKDQPHFRRKGHRSSFLMGGMSKDLLT